MKTQFFEKSFVFSESKYWPIFSRFTEYDKRPGTIYKGLQGI